MDNFEIRPSNINTKPQINADEHRCVGVVKVFSVKVFSISFNEIAHKYEGWFE